MKRTHPPPAAELRPKGTPKSVATMVGRLAQPTDHGGSSFKMTFSDLNNEAKFARVFGSGSLHPSERGFLSPSSRRQTFSEVLATTFYSDLPLLSRPMSWLVKSVKEKVTWQGAKSGTTQVLPSFGETSRCIASGSSVSLSTRRSIRRSRDALTSISRAAFGSQYVIYQF